jgi:hypothetical protein
MPRYIFLDSAMRPTSKTTHIKYITTNVTGMKTASEGSRIQSFPSDNLRYFTTTQSSGITLIFLVRQGLGLATHTEMVHHIAKYTPGAGFKSADGGPDCLTLQHIQHLQTQLPLPTAPIVRFGPMDTPFSTEHVLAWVLVTILAKFAPMSPVTQVMVIDLCVTLFKFRRVYLNRQLVIGIGMAAVDQALAFVPRTVRPILWLMAYHYWPVACMVASGLFLADRAILIAGLYAHCVGKLVYVMILAGLCLLHKYHGKAFVACIMAGSAYIILRLLDLDPARLALALWEVAMAELRQQ